VDRATQEVMRTILHHPAFQSLEAAWRGLYQLVKSVDTGERLKIHIVDLSKSETSTELADATDLKQCALFRLTAGKGYAIAAANFSIGLNMDDLSLIGRMALIARAAECSWIAHGESTLVGCPSWATAPDPEDWKEPEATEEWQMWRAIRRLPESACIGLASPRMLLRMPYGKKAETTERVALEEMQAKPNHGWFLWGNPLFACLQLMGTAFFEDGWRFHPDAYRQIDRLPMYTYVESGATVIQPVAEAVLSDQAAERMMECGLMPLLSEKNGDAALLSRWQSIHEPVAALAGRWAR
jgi:type VI secretion system protein ImpC